MLPTVQRLASTGAFRASAVFGAAAAAVLGLGMLALGHYSAVLGRLLLTALALGLFASLALSPSIVSQRARQRNQTPWLGPAGMAVPVLGFLLAAIGIWATPDSDAFWKSAAIVTILAVGISYCFWFLAYPAGSSSSAGRLAWASMGAAASAGLMASIGVIFEIRLLPWWWVVSLLILVMLVGCVAVPLVRFLAGRRK
ncbi:MAG: hypothetical protein BZY80_02380 [SAR202 cluster bacterium Io17-Chloro-G2]|nr:MAG: hypothetical protein BZY80_02380 [SAR202 cluster bacterium Io17-Chloro-G2]